MNDARERAGESIEILSKNTIDESVLDTLRAKSEIEKFAADGVRRVRERGELATGGFVKGPTRMFIDEKPIARSDFDRFVMAGGRAQGKGAFLEVGRSLGKAAMQMNVAFKDLGVKLRSSGLFETLAKLGRAIQEQKRREAAERQRRVAAMRKHARRKGRKK